MAWPLAGVGEQCRPSAASAARAGQPTSKCPVQVPSVQQLGRACLQTDVQWAPAFHVLVTAGGGWWRLAGAWALSKPCVQCRALSMQGWPACTVCRHCRPPLWSPYFPHSCPTLPISFLLSFLLPVATSLCCFLPSSDQHSKCASLDRIDVDQTGGRRPEKLQVPSPLPPSLDMLLAASQPYSTVSCIFSQPVAFPDTLALYLRPEPQPLHRIQYALALHLCGPLSCHPTTSRPSRPLAD